MTKFAAKLSKVPNVPAVYAMYAGTSARGYIAYVGIADKLKQRLTQHLIRRDSSIVTGVSAVSLNPTLITEVRWWEHPEFADRFALEAAELVAFEVLDPVLRSRGGITERATEIARDAAFHERVTAVFNSASTGILVIQSIQTLIERITQLEERVKSLESASLVRKTL